tara:strand:- start:44711 stop:45631 length:921 start_codon:yes stop_codon:yes gene_type:complete
MLILTTSFKHFTEEYKIPYHNSFQMNFNHGKEGNGLYLPERDELNSIKKNYNKKEFEHLIKIHPRRKVLFSSRFDFSILDSERKFIFLVFIEDPINKIINDYQYLCYSKKNFQINVKNLSLKLYIKKLLSNKLWQSKNEHRELFVKQTDFLFHNVTQSIKKDKIKYLNKKIENGNLIILPIERFFDCSLFLRKKYNNYFPRIYDFSFKFDFLKNKKKEISEDLIRKIEKKFKEDFIMYQQSNDRLSNQLKLLNDKKNYKELKVEIRFDKIFKFYHIKISKIIELLVKFLRIPLRPFLKNFFNQKSK